MRTPRSRQPMAQVTEVKLVDGQFRLAETFALSCPLPEQDEWLPKKLEEAIENLGQAIKPPWRPASATANCIPGESPANYRRGRPNAKQHNGI